MNHPPLLIFGYSEAAMFLRRTPRPKVGAILSIHGGREFGVEADVPRRLDLGFDDADAFDPIDTMTMQRAASRRRFLQENGLVEVAPTAADVAAIIQFAQDVRDVDGHLLCHCGAGISRAPAAALICLASWSGPGFEAECVAEIRRIRPAAVPHVGLIQFADALLGCNGALVAAVQANGS